MDKCINLDDESKIPIETEIESNIFGSMNKKQKIETSDVWNFFTKIDKAKDGIERATCNDCKHEYKVGPKPSGSNYETSHLHRHLQSCKIVEYHNVGELIMDQVGKIRSRKIDQWFLVKCLQNYH